VQVKYCPVGLSGRGYNIIFECIFGRAAVQQFSALVAQLR